MNSTMPPITKIVVAIHGIGSQRRVPKRDFHALSRPDIFELFRIRCPLKLDTTEEGSDIVDGVATPSSGL